MPFLPELDLLRRLQVSMEGPGLDAIRHSAAEVWGDVAAADLTDAHLSKLRDAEHTNSLRLRAATHDDLLGAGLSLAIVRVLLPAGGEALSVERSSKCDCMRADRAWDCRQVEGLIVNSSHSMAGSI